MTESGGATGLGSDGAGASAQTPLAGERFAGDFTDLADAVSLDHSHDDDPGSSDREHRIEFLESESSEHRDSDLETGFDRHGDGDGWNDSHVGDLSYEKSGEVKSSSGGSGGGGHGSYDPAPSGVVHDPVKRNNLNPVTGTAAGPRAWLRINEEGVCTPVTIDKHRLAQHLGVPMRDFRMLEPNRSDSYSAAILCRERCIVMHIEQVRLLITSENIFMQDGRSYTVMKILPELQRRLLMRKLKLMDGRTVPNVPDDERIPGLDDHATEEIPEEKEKESERARFKQKMSNLGVDASGRPLREVLKGTPVGAPAAAGVVGNASTQDGGGVKKETAKKDGAGGKQKEKKASKEKPPIKIPGDDESDEEGGVSLAGPRRRDRMLLSRDNEETLPFELVGLEVALEIVCNTLERDRRDVGEEVRASLGGLRKKVDTSNLERVRRVKSKVTRLTGRVAKVREEIKRYLDDDSDMRDMYLTRKALMEANALSGGNENMGGSGDYSAFRMGRPSVNYGKNFVGFNRGGGSDFLHGSGGSFKMRRQSLSFGGGGDGFGDYPGSGNQDPAQDRTGDGKNPGVASGGNASGLPQTPQNVEREKDTDLFGDEVYIHQEDSDLQVVEDLLETYFAHIDSTYAELDAIDQFINDTEDFVNIQLDVTRNQLQKFEVTLTSATLFVSMYSMIGGIYGMNLRNGAEDSHSTFVVVNALCGAGSVLGFGLIMLYIRSKRWM